MTCGMVMLVVVDILVSMVLRSACDETESCWSGPSITKYPAAIRQSCDDSSSHDDSDSSSVSSVAFELPQPGNRPSSSSSSWEYERAR
jgi:hypothetical protein